MKMKPVLWLTLAASVMALSAPVAAEDDRYDDDYPRSSRSVAKRDVKYIGAAKAGRIAAARVGGRVRDVDLDTDDGAAHYDVDVIKGGREYQVTVDARSGRVISSRRDD